MYSYLLATHSIFRWLVLLFLLYSIFRAYSGWLGGKEFTSRDNSLRLITVSIVHIQLILGICLYFISPTVEYFLGNFQAAVQERAFRFFGMEHSVSMLISVILITIGSAVSRRKASGRGKYKAIAIWFTVALIIILVSVPWPFSPMVQRPYLRGF